MTGKILHAVEGEVVPDEEAAEVPPAGVRPVGQRPAYYAIVPTLVSEPDGSRCLRNLRYRFDDPAAAAAAANIRQNFEWQVTVGGWLLCRTTPASEPTPAQEAVTFWRIAGEDLLPKPAPRIAPGYMLAGKLAYLEAGTQSTARFEHPTPLGTLVIEATSRLMVDWGDGFGLTGPHTGPGAPWPNGTITHFWTTAATYDVRVVQQWTGRWTLGAASGALDGLETQAVIDDFEVRQLQAVRNY
ncbi:MAG: hypothetical protein ACR2MO_10930 [Acidimicrobiales bacterium]